MSEDKVFQLTVLRMVSEANLGGDKPVGLFRKYDDIVAELKDKTSVDESLKNLKSLGLVREVSSDFQAAKGYELGYTAYQVTELGKSSLESKHIPSNEKIGVKPKEIRRKVLEVLYAHRSEAMGADINDVKKALPGIEDKILHQEISYLEGKYLAEPISKFMGKAYLNYLHVRITAAGIDLVEDPEAFGKLFAINLHQNNFSDISGSNISINSQYVSQIIDKQDDDTKELLKQLLEATDKKDMSAILKTLGYIGDKSIDLLIAIIAGGIKL